MVAFHNLTSLSRKTQDWMSGRGEHLLDSWRLDVFRHKFRLQTLRLLHLEPDESSMNPFQAMNVACFARCFAEEVVRLHKIKRRLPYLERVHVSVPHKYLHTWYARLLKDFGDGDEWSGRSWALNDSHIEALLGPEDSGPPPLGGGGSVFSVLNPGTISRFDLLLCRPFEEALAIRCDTVGTRFFARWCLRSDPDTGFQTNAEAERQFQATGRSGETALALRIEKFLCGLESRIDREKALCEFEIGNMTPKVVLGSVRRVSDGISTRVVSNNNNNNNINSQSKFINIKAGSDSESEDMVMDDYINSEVFSPAVQWLECTKRVRSFEILMGYIRKKRLYWDSDSDGTSA